MEARVMSRLAPQSEQSAYSRTNPVSRVDRVAARYAVDGSIPIPLAAHASQKLRPAWASRKSDSRWRAVITVMPRDRSTFPAKRRAQHGVDSAIRRVQPLVATLQALAATPETKWPSA